MEQKYIHFYNYHGDKINEVKNMNDIIPFRGENPIWDSFSQLEKEFDRFFETPFFSMVSENKRQYPKVNIKENEKEYSVDIALPRYEKNDVNIEFKDGCLHIQSVQKKESEIEKNKYIHKEISGRAFYRTIPFIEKIDDNRVEAVYKNGIITVTLPKIKTKEIKTKKIEIR